MFIRAYLRASTKEQDAERAKEALIEFASQHGHRIAAFYIENESGTIRDRRELQRLIKDSHENDILLIEQVDRLSRLDEKDWIVLKNAIGEAGLRIVSIDLPTSHTAMTMVESDTFTSQILKAINNMMLDMLAAIARKDYEDRRRRQTEGIAKAKIEGRFKGRPADMKRQKQVITLKEKGVSLTDIQSLTGYSRASVARILKEYRESS